MMEEATAGLNAARISLTLETDGDTYVQLVDSILNDLREYRTNIDLKFKDGASMSWIEVGVPQDRLNASVKQLEARTREELARLDQPPVPPPGRLARWLAGY